MSIFIFFILGLIILFVNPLKNINEINGVNNECEITTVLYNILYYDKITNDIKKLIHQPGSITIERIVFTLHLYGRISAFDRVMCYRRIDE